MKYLIKKISLLLVITMILAISFGCTPKKEATAEKLSLNTGFLAKKSVEDNKNYLSIAVNGDTIKLEVKDINIFNELVDNEYYMFAYDENNVLKSIEANSYIKNLVQKSMEQGINTTESTTILSNSKVDVESLTLLDSLIIDFDKDGNEETVELYADVEKYNGELAWDDGQNWLLVVRDENKDYVLFDDYVQLGTISFYAYFQEIDQKENFVITTIQSGTANLKLTEYRYNADEDNFIVTVKFEPKGHVNMFHQGSQGY